MKSIKIKKSNLIILFTIFLYRLLLDQCYFKVIVPLFSSYGFHDYRNITYLIMSWLVLVFFIIPIKSVLNEKNASFSNIVIFILTIISIIPFSTLVYSGIFSKSFIIVYIIYWITVFIVYFSFKKIKIKPRNIKIGDKILNDKFIIIFGIASVLFILYISYKYTHFRLNFNFFKVYELRSEASNYGSTPLYGYLFPLARMINILFLAYCLKRKKYLGAILFFLAQMLSFGIDGLKSAFFMPIIVIVTTLFYKKDNYTYYKKIVLYGIPIVSLLGILEKLIFNTFYIVNIIIRRVLFIPVFLNSCYVDFFSKNKPDYFFGSFMKLFGFKTNYPNLGNIIGDVYFNQPGMNCNNGLISDAVSNLGLWGIVILPIILILVLRFMDICADNVDERIFLASAIYFAVILSNTFLFTALLTHGMFFGCLVLFFMKEKRSTINESS